MHGSVRRARWMAASGAEIHAHELDDRGGGFSADSTDSRGDDAGGGYHDAELSRGAETRDAAGIKVRRGDTRWGAERRWELREGVVHAGGADVGFVAAGDGVFGAGRVVRDEGFPERRVSRVVVRVSTVV